MKTRTVILIFTLVCISVFTFLTIRYTNHNLERTFRDSSRNAFYLLSFMVDHYLSHEKAVEEEYVQQLRNKFTANPEGLVPSSISMRNTDNHGLWIFKGDSTFGTIEYKNFGKEILNFYKQNLKGKNEHTLIIFDGKPFLLINTNLNSTDILILSQAPPVVGTRIEQILDSLITSSNLRYFAIVDENKMPILFSTLYENFLPLKGPGQHLIDTPDGRILQIMEIVGKNSIVAGFEMESLNRVLRQNNVFLLLVILIFVALEGVLLTGYLKFERFRFRKEKEIKRFKEVGALSTGFAHEFRNSLHALTLLAKELDKENKSILLDETNRMKAIMDSLRSLSTEDIESSGINTRELVDESVALLDHFIKENNAAILQDIDENAGIKGNRPLLVTALSNVIKNSVEAGATSIKIDIHKKGKRIKIDIADDGTGIDPTIADQVFEPFFSKKGQSGIGLYLTKRIVELHDGEIELKRNKYTVISIILPA